MKRRDVEKEAGKEGKRKGVKLKTTSILSHSSYHLTKLFIKSFDRVPELLMFSTIENS